MASDDGKRPNKSGRRSDIPWSDIRSAFEIDGIENVSELSRRFQVKRQSIIKRRDSEKWTTKGQVSNDVQGKVVDILTRKTIDALGGDEGLRRAAQDTANQIAATLAAQAPLYEKAAKLLDKTFDKAINGTLQLGVTQGETTAVTDLLNALSKFTRDGRLINGLKDGTANTQAAELEDQVRVDQAVLIVRQREAQTA